MNIIFNNKKINKRNFYKNKNYLRYMTLMLIRYQSKNHMLKKAHLNTSLGILMMMSLDHYV